MQINHLGRYDLVAELAQGGMGTVYLGVARGPAGFSKLMVIKLLRPELAEDPQFLGMFLEEARLAARLSHPNVVQTVEVGAQGNVHFLVMEHLDGQSLQRMRARVGKDGDFPLGVHLAILVEALHGLHYAHELRDVGGAPLEIVHRDVSPHNVFVTYDGQVKVVDFGIAKAVDSSLETRTGELKGKIAYMAPEQALGKKVDRRADLFAIGVMLWEAVARRRMWKDMNDVNIVHALMTAQLPSLREARPDVDPELERIVAQALAMAPENRPATAEALAAELESWMQRHGQQPTPREAGRLLGEAFAADRDELRGTLEAQLRKLRELPDVTPSSPGLPPTYAPADLTRTGAGSRAGAAPATRDGTGATQSAFTGSPGLAAGAAPAPKPFPVGLALGALGAVTLLAGGVFALALWHKEALTAPAPPAATRPAAPASASPSGASPSDADRIVVTLAADPPGARFFVDGTPVDGNPYAGPYKKDGLTHQIRAEAAGYEAERFAVVFDADVTRRFAMRKRAAPSGAGAKPAPSASAEGAPDAPRKPARGIDTAYPAGR